MLQLVLYRLTEWFHLHINTPPTPIKRIQFSVCTFCVLMTEVNLFNCCNYLTSKSHPLCPYFLFTVSLFSSSLLETNFVPIGWIYTSENCLLIVLKLSFIFASSRHRHSYGISHWTMSDLIKSKKESGIQNSWAS